MYKKLQESLGNVLGYEVWGKLTGEELGSILADIEEAIERFGKVTCSSTSRRHRGRTSAPSGRISSSPVSTRRM